MKFAFFITLSFMLLRCGAPDVASIEIVVKDNTVTIDGELVQSDSLEQILQQKKKAFGDRQPTIVLKVASDTKRGKLADLEAILRKLNLRKIQYTNLDDSQSS